MAEPRPPRPESGALADRIAALESQVAALRSPTGTQRAGAVGGIQATVDYLASLQRFGSTGPNAISLSNRTAIGSVEWFLMGTGAGTLANIANIHVIGPIARIPTGKVMIEASAGEASITPGGGFMIAYVSFSVRTGNSFATSEGATVIRSHGISTGRLYFNQRIGAGLTTGRVLVDVPTNNLEPLWITGQIGVWGETPANTSPISAVFNTPSVFAEIVG